MMTTITIDKAGRIVLPKPVRDELELLPGDTLELESADEGITLRPVRKFPRMYRKHGVLVFDSGEPLAADVVTKTIRAVRGERDRRNLGRMR